MANKKTIYPKGVRFFSSHTNAPDFVMGTVTITLSDFINFCKDNKDLLTKYNNMDQIKLELLKGDKGPYFVVDTYNKFDTAKKEAAPFTDNDDPNLPF